MHMDRVRQLVRYWCDDTFSGKCLGKGVTAAVLDTGLAPHPDFRGRVRVFLDLTKGKKQLRQPYDDSGHGTHVAGILAGDGLLSLAFWVLSQTGNLKVMQAVTRGAFDMVAGQSMDLNGPRDAESLFDMHAKKTGALIRAAVLAGAYSAGNPDVGRHLAALTSFAEHYGLLFQITDDILDVVGDPAQLGKSIGKDEREHKATFVTLYGLEPAREEAAIAARAAVTALGQIDGDREFLTELVQRTLTRSR